MRNMSGETLAQKILSAHAGRKLSIGDIAVINVDYVLAHDTTTTPWYPSMTLHRQARQGDWSTAIAGVKAQIEGITA